MGGREILWKNGARPKRSQFRMDRKFAESTLNFRDNLIINDNQYETYRNNSFEHTAKSR